VQVLEMLKQEPMGIVVEVFASHEERHVIADVRLQQHAAENGTLSICADWLFTKHGKV